MNIVIKILLSLLFAILLAIGGLLVYYSVDRTIRVDFIPSEFQYCGQVITDHDSEYISIVEWLKANDKGWNFEWNTPIAGAVYASPAFSISVFKSGVSVAYKTDTGFDRFIKTVEHNLPISCEMAANKGN